MRVMTDLGARPVGAPISVSDLRMILNGTFAQAAQAARSLAEVGLLTRRPITCLVCDSELPDQNLRLDEVAECPECQREFELWSQQAYEIADGINYDTFRKAIQAEAHELDARDLARFWQQQGQIAYVIIDIISSERAQRDHSAEFQRLVDTTLRKLWPAAMSVVSGEYLLLDERGDEARAAFKSPIHAYHALMRFLAFLRGNHQGVSKLDWYDDGAGNSPRFSATIGIIYLGNVEVSDVLVRTLNDTWTVHHEGVAALTRISGLASPKLPELRREPWRMSLVITDDALTPLKSAGLADELPETTFSKLICKHPPTVTQANVAAVLYYDVNVRVLTSEEVG